MGSITTSRRRFLGATAVVPLAATHGLTKRSEVTHRPGPGALNAPQIRRRRDWAPDLPIKAPIEAEQVRFLLVHHTSEPGSDYQPEDVEGILRQIYSFHTGAEKDWPDIAYNFFVDKFGTIWEGRTGSVDGPIRGSATGGNQGFSQLCCFLGDFEAEPPPEAAVSSMITLLAWLADRYKVDVTPGATTTFASRGSNLHPPGKEVITGTISTHRQMSQTACPGTACHQMVVDQFQGLVAAQIPPAAPPGTTEPTTPPTTSSPGVVATPPSDLTTVLEAGRNRAEQAGAPRPTGSRTDSGSGPLPIILGSGAAAVAGALAVGAWSNTRSRAIAPAVSGEPGTAGLPTATSNPTNAIAPSASRFVPSVNEPVGSEPNRNVTTVGSPAVWWPNTTSSGTAGAATANETLVFWLVGSAYSQPARTRIESSMRASLDRFGATAWVSPGPWFTQMLSTILPGLTHPPGSGLLLGLATSGQCLALSAGNARVDIPEVTGRHKPRPPLPGIDPRSGMAHRWNIPVGVTWLAGWLGGPGTLSVGPEIVAANLAQGREQDPELLGSAEGYLGVRLVPPANKPESP